jgi:annexin A7/11
VIDKVLTVLSASSSTAQLRAISEAYQRRYQQTLAECIRNEFSGHMKDALLYMVYRATDPAKVSAMRIERVISFCRDHEANSAL